MYLRPEFYASVPGTAQMKQSRGEVGKVLKTLQPAGDQLTRKVQSISSLSLGSGVALGRAGSDAITSSGALTPEALEVTVNLSDIAKPLDEGLVPQALHSL